MTMSTILMHTICGRRLHQHRAHVLQPFDVAVGSRCTLANASRAIWRSRGDCATISLLDMAWGLKEDFDFVSAMDGRSKRARRIVQTIREQISRHGRSPLGDQTHVQELN